MANGEDRRMLQEAVLAVGNVQISAQMAADALDTLNKLVVGGSLDDGDGRLDQDAFCVFMRGAIGQVLDVVEDAGNVARMIRAAEGTTE